MSDSLADIVYYTPEADFVPNYDEDTSDGEGIDSTDGEETDSTECVESSCSDDGNLAPDEEAEADALNYLKTSPRAVRGRRRALKKHVHIADRLEADSEIWRNKRDEELGDILKPERMGYFRLVGDPNGSIVQQQDGHYVDEASGERIKFSAFSFHQPSGRLNKAELLRKLQSMALKFSMATSAIADRVVILVVGTSVSKPEQENFPDSKKTISPAPYGNSVVSTCVG